VATALRLADGDSIKIEFLLEKSLFRICRLVVQVYPDPAVRRVSPLLQ